MALKHVSRNEVLAVPGESMAGASHMPQTISKQPFCGVVADTSAICVIVSVCMQHRTWSLAARMVLKELSAGNVPRFRLNQIDWQINAGLWGTLQGSSTFAWRGTDF